MSAIDTDVIGKLVDMAKANGPFFFSVFLSMLWVWTIKKSIELFGKPDGDKVLRLTLLSFSGVFLVGSLVVAWRAIDWWVASQNTPFGRYATILGIPNDIAIWADAAELYQQRKEAQASPTHSIRLAFLSKAQCAEKDALILQLNRQGMNKPDTFPIGCTSFDDNWQTNQSFALDVDEKTGALVLVEKKNGLASKQNQQREKTGALNTILLPPAYAADLSVGRPVINSVTVRGYTPLNSLDEVNEAAKELQNTQAPPGEKLDILGRLMASPVVSTNMLNDRINNNLSEPLYATLLDLQRHSDKQIAVKTRLLLNRLPLGKDVATLAATKKPENQAALTKIIASMSDVDIDNLQESAKEKGKQGMSVAALLSKRKTLGSPVPTYTKDGDRFYVKAHWKDNDEKSIQCIGKAYFDHWGGESLKQQVDLVRSRTTRTVYYTKEWATEMYERLRACGAEVSYVQGF